MRSFLLKFKDPKYLLKIAVLAGVYYLAALFGQSLSYSGNNVSLIWPPAGISVAVLLIFGLDLWPGVAIGAFASTVTTQPSPLIALGMTTGNTLEALSAVLLLRMFNFKRSIETVRDVLIFIVFAALVSTIFAATFGTLSLVLGNVGTWDNFRFIWQNWWVGDFLGDMIIAPLILVWSRPFKFKFTLLNIVEGLLLTLAVLLTSIGLFTGTFPTISFSLQNQFKYLIFPLLIWGSYKFRQRGSTLLVFLVTAVALWGIVTGGGPFVTHVEAEQNLLSLAVFSAVISFTFMIFSVIIEERNAAETKVVDSERRFKSLIENSSDVIVLIGSNGIINYTSPSTYKVLQYKPEELLGTSSFDRIYSEDKERLINLFHELVAKPEKNIEATFRLVRKDGDVIWVDGIGTNLLSDPTISSIILNYRDVTERQKLDESKSEFVSLSAHQLRAPVAAIRWYTESLMGEASFPKNLRKYLDEIYSAILSMNDTVNVLLDVSRFELGTIQVKGEEVDLSELLREAIKEKSRIINQKKIKINDATTENIPKVVGDKKLIGLILDNLLSNAIKYSSIGGKIEVGLRPQKASILFKIGDSGIGIPIKDQPKIFTKLFRGSNVNKIDPSGLGLGLYLIKKVIDLKGGKIWFESGEGKGTTFFVEFPKKVKVK